MAKVLLLLNAGKGKEFKGKSLEDVNLTEDDVLDLHATTNVENIKNKEDDDGAVEIPEILIQKETNVNRRCGRTKWSKAEKGLVLTHFKKHIRTKKLLKTRMPRFHF